jgi:hypothetical protein
MNKNTELKGGHIFRNFFITVLIGCALWQL